MAIARAMPAPEVGLEALAQWYAATFGWEVFPCRGKSPAFKSPHSEDETCHGECGQLGHSFYDASADPEKIAKMWRLAPNANIGWKIPDGIVVLDSDDRHKGVDTLADLQLAHGGLPRTVMSLSGSGQGSNHRLLRIPVGHPLCGKLGPGVDVKSRGGYLILPYSVHPDTYDPYRWAEKHLPGEVAIADAPVWVLDLLRQGAASNVKSEGVPLDPNAVIHEGERNVMLFEWAKHYRDRGFSIEETRVQLRERNKKFEPPSPEKEIASTLRSAFKGHITVDVTPSGSPRAANGNGWATKERPPLVFTDLADMLNREYPLPRWLIKDLIPEGLVFLVGSPKSSKTYLALSLAVEVERGGEWFGRYPVKNPGPIVYLTLEDSEGASRRRIAQLSPSLRSIPRDRFIFMHGLSIPRFNEGLYDALKDVVIARYAPSLIVLDPISYLYAPVRKNADQFSEVKDMLLPLHWLGHEHHCTIVGVDHRRKKSAEDVDIFETTYGSNAKSAVVDAMLMIVREQTDITLHARLREAADQTITLGLTFDDNGVAIWTWKGAADGLLDPGQYGDLRLKTVDALEGFGRSLSVSELMLAINVPDSLQTKNALRKMLSRMERDREVERTARGQYIWTGEKSSVNGKSS